MPEFGARLCFDATRQFHDIGRMINHCPRGYNLQPGPPLYVLGKWLVGTVAVHDILPDQELSYDYNVRTEERMKSRGKKVEGSDGGQEETVNSSGGGACGTENM